MFENLIIKFLDGSSNLEELSMLMRYLHNKENAETFKSFVKSNYYSIYAMQDIDIKEILEIVQKRIDSEQKN